MAKYMVQQNLMRIPESPLSHFFFSDTRMAWLWLIVRLYVGWEWLHAGWLKVMNPAWVGSDAGAAIKGFLMGSLQKTGGAHPDVQWWYADFVRAYALDNTFVLSHMVAFGELFVGIALILGIFVGTAAFFGAFMNMNFLLAGTVSANPIFLLLGILLLMAWRVAGWYGLGHYMVPLLGVPWRLGALFRHPKAAS
jgi:thiosulfate dehydrogenase (quinone) large subunit